MSTATAPTDYAFSAFTEQIKAAFYAFQVQNPTIERLRADDAMNVQYWLLNPRNSSKLPNISIIGVFGNLFTISAKYVNSTNNTKYWSIWQALPNTTIIGV